MAVFVAFYAAIGLLITIPMDEREAPDFADKGLGGPRRIGLFYATFRLLAILLCLTLIVSIFIPPRAMEDSVLALTFLAYISSRYFRDCTPLPPNKSWLRKAIEKARTVIAAVLSPSPQSA
jgi:hypothetical protein